MDTERRAHPRKVVSTAVTFHDPGGAPLRGWVHDISRGGCYIATPSYLTFGETVQFEFRLGDARISGLGRVVWVREKNERGVPAGMGVSFVTVSPETLAVIDGLSVATGARLSRPNTVIGIAPAPAPSSPSYSPDVLPSIDLELTAAEAEPPAPAPAPAGAPSPLGSLPRAPGPRRVRWIAAGVAGVVILGAIVAVAVALKHESSASAAADAEPSAADGTDAELVDAPTEEDAASVDAEVADTAAPIDRAAMDASSPTDAGARDAGRHHKRYTKPHRKTKPHKHK